MKVGRLVGRKDNFFVILSVSDWERVSFLGWQEIKEAEMADNATTSPAKICMPWQM